MDIRLQCNGITCRSLGIGIGGDERGTNASRCVQTYIHLLYGILYFQNDRCIIINWHQPKPLFEPVRGKFRGVGGCPIDLMMLRNWASANLLVGTGRSSSQWRANFPALPIFCILQQEPYVVQTAGHAAVIQTGMDGSVLTHLLNGS